MPPTPGKQEWYLRRACPEDARAIHDVHMRSIRENCTQDHTLAEIAAWSGRPYDESRRLWMIANCRVWVVQRRGEEPLPGPIPEPTASLAGFGSLYFEPAPSKQARIHALYFGSEVIRLGFGRELLQRMIEEARNEGSQEIVLESSLTAHAFYKHCGFEDSGPMTSVEIQGERIRCYPMIYRF
jgi:GNAT superfamily N-acetyltransferase